MLGGYSVGIVAGFVAMKTERAPEGALWWVEGDVGGLVGAPVALEEVGCLVGRNWRESGGVVDGVVCLGPVSACAKGLGGAVDIVSDPEAHTK